MGVFDFFKKKKKEPEYDPSNITIRDLRKGFVLDYDLKTWEVKAEFEYDWGNNFFSREFKLDSGDEVVYLHLSEDDEIYLTISKKIKIRNLDEDLPEYIAQHEQPPKKLIFEGKTYFLDKESPGYFRDFENPGDKDEDWCEMISWEYYDSTEKLVLSVEQWGEREFEASYGKVVGEFSFSNILPSSSEIV
ncbi:DUF4178 domain-containing protein [Xanthovirga aplysinae]|uniref:DUF4178 domain-containing protein n=1 Tax=Xanthovirga aplysinae TaxID=2529853 RepID=UPI0012BD70FD|nr:DUF4178 domain-containing protein [Xanthovirga aplysinae]MTI32317.1 DUF4178 domain-containing protein [Xanthovirga aplysinae]